MSKINDKELSKLFSLSRIDEENNKNKRKKLLKDLERILDYFKELEEINTDNIESMPGGTFLKNIYREDEENNMTDGKREKQVSRLRREFPDKENNHLKVPQIFS